jgi:hypothetical protein
VPEPFTPRLTLLIAEDPLPRFFAGFSSPALSILLYSRWYSRTRSAASTLFPRFLAGSLERGRRGWPAGRRFSRYCLSDSISTQKSRSRFTPLIFSS